MSFEIDGSAVVKDSPFPYQQVGIKEREISSSEFKDILKQSINENRTSEENDIETQDDAQLEIKVNDEKLNDTNQTPANQEPPDQPEENQDKKTENDTENEQNSSGEEVNLELDLNLTETFVNVEVDSSNNVLADEEIVNIPNVSDNSKEMLLTETPAEFSASESVQLDGQKNVLFQETEPQGVSDQSNVEAKNGVVPSLQNQDSQSEVAQTEVAQTEVVQTEVAQTNSVEDISSDALKVDPKNVVEPDSPVKVDPQNVVESDLLVKDVPTDTISQETLESQDLPKEEIQADGDSQKDKKTHQMDNKNVDFEQNKSSTESSEQRISVTNEKKISAVTESLSTEKVSQTDSLDDSSEAVKSNVVVENQSVAQNQSKKIVQEKKTDYENELLKTVEDKPDISIDSATKQNRSGNDSNQQQFFQSSQQDAKADVSQERDISREIIDLNESAQSNKQSFQTDLDSKLVEKEVNTRRFEDIEELQKNINDQIKAQLKVSNFNDVKRSEIKFTLKPENLGELSMKLTMENSNLIARIKVESQVVKEVLELNIDDLKKNLSEQGIKVEKVEVTLKNDTTNMGSLDDRANKDNIAREQYRNKNQKYTEEYNKENDNVTSRVTRKTDSQNGRIDYLI